MLTGRRLQEGDSSVHEWICVLVRQGDGGRDSIRCCRIIQSVMSPHRTHRQAGEVIIPSLSISSTICP